MQPLTRVLVAYTYLMLAACAYEPKVCDFFDPSELTLRRDFEKMSASPLVLVGTVASVRVESRGARACRQRNMLLDLTRVDVDVENRLRGSMGDRSVSFRFFAYAPENGGYSGPPRYQVSPGDRRIFFLTQDALGLRAIGDVLDYTIHVTSGSHLGQALAPDVGEAISQVLLTLAPGYGATFSNNLPKYSSISDRFGSRPLSAALLRDLASSAPNSEIRVAACFELAISYYGQYGCLASVRDDSRLSAEARMKARELLVAQQQRNPSFAKSLTTDALISPTKAPFPDSLRRVREEIEMLLLDPDPSIRRAACVALKRHFPVASHECVLR